jgi:hypothetical protein
VTLKNSFMWCNLPGYLNFIDMIGQRHSRYMCLDGY